MQHKKFPLQSCLEVLAAQYPRFCKQCYFNFVCVHVCEQLVLLRIRAICCVIYETSYILKSESYGQFATLYAQSSGRSAGGSLLCASQLTPLCFWCRGMVALVGKPNYMLAFCPLRQSTP